MTTNEQSEASEQVREGTLSQKKLLHEYASAPSTDRQAKKSLFHFSSEILRALIIPVGAVVMLCGLFMYGSGALLNRANDLGRQCAGVALTGGESIRKYKFGMVTCSDGSSSIPQRSFEGLMELITPNKQSYVQRHGYDFIDASDLLDRRRPPSWSKILAVRKHLPQYDWIFWNDADSLVTNPSIALEDIISATVGSVDFEDMPDFIVTEDVTGVNAGMFFLRNSKWSLDFLDLWWNQTSFIKPIGECKSGDNDALKYLMKIMPEKEKEKHIWIPYMQCVFNSNLWRPSWKSSHRLITLTKSVWQGSYSRGDFMVHLAGIDNKRKWIERILEDIDADGKSVRSAGRSILHNSVQAGGCRLGC
ncbi:hypothetical protein O6H91_03G053400 [Diphasiastrum complanatum]|uniref:Uncharacterized protein n=2 Tax=Diphasiastrum complanatum TaxID=34168 RepID=A0ACC2E6C5_DIPCM|nr:hypothetical protein O6H91_03G053400 [Diphasiastrum complanatum]KAJ7562055.1 hypothetical protein O6H91_03G053400 [Diphasiastrum complanatum]